ncbi:MAG: PAS domain-containing protein, partial [Bdellovibrionales bacterium]|nr:PAS domain-containing protein [Bdellovibrionales bacterium]
MSKESVGIISAGPCILIFDSQDKLAYQNSAAKHLFGQLDITRSQGPSLFSKESWAQFTQIFTSLRTSQGQSHAWTSVLESEGAKTPIFWQMGKEADGIFVVGTSIGTVEKLPGFAMSQQSLEDIVANVPGMVYQFRLGVDGSVSFPFVSRHAFGLYGVTEADFKKDPALFLNSVHPNFQGEVHKLIEESAQKLQIFSWAGKIITPTGEEKWIQARSVPALQNDGSILWSGILTDHTHEKFLEEEVHKQRSIAEHQSKLASIGQLASGIGHEINNPLMILTGKIQQLK